MESREVEIGRAARELREAAGLSQEVVAAEMVARGHLKWSQSTVWSVEKGSRPLRFSEAEALASILRTNLDMFGVSADMRVLLFYIDQLRLNAKALGAAASHLARTQRHLREVLRRAGYDGDNLPERLLERPEDRLYLELPVSEIAQAATEVDGGEVGVVYSFTPTSDRKSKHGVEEEAP